MLAERYDNHLQLKVHPLKYPGMVLDSLALSFHSLALCQPIKFHRQISSKGMAKFKRDNIIDHTE